MTSNAYTPLVGDKILVLGHTQDSIVVGWWYGGYKEVESGSLPARKIEWLKFSDFHGYFSSKAFFAILDEGRDPSSFERLLFVVMLGQSRWRGRIGRFFAKGTRNLSLSACSTRELVYPSLPLPKNRFADRTKRKKRKSRGAQSYSSVLSLKLRRKSKPKLTLSLGGRKCFWRQVSMVTRMDAKNVGKLLDLATKPILEELGLEKVALPQRSYTINEGVLDAAADDSQCVAYLRRTAVGVFPLLDENLKSIALHLEKEFPSVAKEVISALNRTGTMVHQAVFGLKSERGTMFVTLADEAEHILCIEEWKFRKLVEHHGETRLLHEFSARRFGDPEDHVAFDAHKSGRIVANLNLSRGTIKVACLEMKNGATAGQATFYVDTSYVLALWTVLTRLREDTERFERMKENAETHLGFDPFIREEIPHGKEEK